MKNDNSHFEEKLKLRDEVVRNIGKKHVRVLECYSGIGKLWSCVNVEGVSVSVTRIEKQKGKNMIALEGDNMKYLPSLDLSRYDIIDLDAYGIPAEQIMHIISRGYHGYVIVTAITSRIGGLPNALLIANGYTEKMLSKTKTLFTRNPLEKLKNFLYICKIKTITGYFFRNERKSYFYFNV